MAVKNIMVLWIIAIHMHLHCGAQEAIKYEREIEIDSNLAPKKSRVYVANLTVDSVHWVKEINFDGKSFEAKARWNGLPTSIEFDTTGKLEDIEITVDELTIDMKCHERMIQFLNAQFKAIKIEKIQLQFSGSSNAVQERMNKGLITKDLNERYEVELFGNIKTNWRFFEFLFDKNGNFISRREISQIRLEYSNF